MSTKFILAKLPCIEIIEFEGEFKKIKIDSELVECGDSYHSMSELYDHRRALSVALLNLLSIESNKGYDPTFKSKFHSDGTMFEGYFVVGIRNTTNKETYSWMTYHYSLEHWDEFKIPEYERAPKYDGHTSQDVIERLLRL